MKGQISDMDVPEDKFQAKYAPKVVEPKLEKYGSATVTIQSLVDAIVKVTGTVTGKKYIFNGAGSTQLVDILDKDDLLNKKRGRACCGGNSGKSLFQLV